jgi:hypothetical protein
VARRAVLILLLCAVAGCGGGDKRDRAASAGYPELTPAIAKDLDAALAGKVRGTGVPGASASVV